MGKERKRSAVILLIEDDLDDQRIMRRLLEKSTTPNKLFTVGDGTDALAYLYRKDHYKNAQQAPRPDLIVLDLNLPRLDGRQVLHRIKQDEELRSIPVVVVTTSSTERDRKQSMVLGADSYFTKPVAADELLDVFQRLR